MQNAGSGDLRFSLSYSSSSTPSLDSNFMNSAAPSPMIFRQACSALVSTSSSSTICGGDCDCQHEGFGRVELVVHGHWHLCGNVLEQELAEKSLRGEKWYS